MERIPFGVSRFDEMIGGGAPAGSVVLLAGESGAGAREFCYTSAAMNALATADSEGFDLYYGDLGASASPPADVHYVTFTDESAAVVDEMRYALADDLVDAAAPALSIADFSQEYFQLSPVPTEWYSDRTPDIRALGESTDRQDVLAAVSEYLTVNAPGNLVVIDSVTDLIAAATDRLDPADLTFLLKGLARATYRWGGLVLLLVNVEPLDARTLGRLKEAADGTLLFEWETGGSERARTLVVEEFRGVLSRLEDENIVRFETEIGDTGFDVSNVRKIR